MKKKNHSQSSRPPGERRNGPLKQVKKGERRCLLRKRGGGEGGGVKVQVEDREEYPGAGSNSSNKKGRNHLP